MKHNKSKLSIKKISQQSLEFLFKYRFIIFFISVSIVIGIMLIQIMNVSTKEPSTQQKEEASKTIKVIEINQSTLNVIRDLQSQNIEVDALFEQGRTDPFSN